MKSKLKITVIPQLPVSIFVSGRQKHFALKALMSVVYGSILLFGAPACEEFTEIDPPKTQLVGELVFSDDDTANSAMIGLYLNLMRQRNFVNTSVTLLTGLAADEIKAASSNPFFENELTSNDSDVASMWNTAYRYIFHVNAIITGLEKSTTVTVEVKNRLEGEAKFIRALCHFYLLNLFGNVPYITTTDYQINSQASRTPMSIVYDNVIADLEDSKNLLSEDYITGERIRPNQTTAAALLARVYLYTEDWVKAEEHATMVIDNALYTLETDLNNVFLANSNEAIWQLMPFVPGLNTWEGFTLIPVSFPQYSLGDQLLASFEIGDNRNTSWVGTFNDGATDHFFANKYKIRTGSPVTEYYMVLRLAEQYLIRSEARAQQNKLTQALEDVDIIRGRAGLSLLQDTNPTINQADLLLAIEQERRVELFAEIGHRWLDLKRTNRVDAILGATKSNWQPTDALFPIPELQILRDSNITQNPGY